MFSWASEVENHTARLRGREKRNRTSIYISEKSINILFTTVKLYMDSYNEVLSFFIETVVKFLYINYRDTVNTHI